jgi:hypothetical protein
VCRREEPKREDQIAECLILLNVSSNFVGNFVCTHMGIGLGGGGQWVCRIMIPKTTFEVEIVPLAFHLSANQLGARPFDPSIKLVHMKEPKQLSDVEIWRFPCILQLRGEPKDNQSRRTSPLKLKLL